MSCIMHNRIWTNLIEAIARLEKKLDEAADKAEKTEKSSRKQIRRLEISRRKIKHSK